ncbi:MAG TPA: SAM-dependent methyltransferase [Aquiluna sp.]
MSQTESFFESPKAKELAVEIAKRLDANNQLSLINEYRKLGIDPEMITFALNQARYKQRGIVKFGERASEMLFTEAGLEQATRQQVAAWHASRFNEASIASVTDLGAGIGSDAIGFADAGLEVTAVENHPESFQALKHNLATIANATALEQDATNHQISSAGVWLDPARRDQDRKSLTVQRLEPSMFSPNLDFVFEIANQYPAGIKLAPGFPHELIPANFEANWVSHHGDLVEMTLWSGRLGQPGIKKAVMVGETVSEFVGTDQRAAISEIERYLYEPDVSLIRSHLVGDYANQNGLHLISEQIAYLSSAKLVSSPWVKGYEVLDVLPLDVKQIKAYCSKHDIGVLEIKKRGVDVTPEALRPKLKLKGAGASTLVLTKVGSARQAIVCKSIR